MTTDLKAAQVAAHAAWLAAKGPAERATAEAVLSSATAAVAAAKRAAAAEAAPAAVSLDQVLSERADQAKVAEHEKAVLAAVRLLHAAQEWPRCGQGWPATAAEDRADALLRANLKLAQALAA